MLKHLRSFFFTGLLVLLPIIISVKLVFWGFETTDKILGKLLNQILLKYFYFTKPVPGLGLVVLLFLITLTGIIAKHYLGKKLIALGERVLAKIPILNIVYNISKQIMESFSTKEKNAFRKVVLIEYPRVGIYSPGFITGDAPLEITDKTGKQLVNVFVPTAPNPATGYLVFVPIEELTMLDISVEDGFKLVLSAGIIKVRKDGAGVGISKQVKTNQNPCF